MWGLNHPERRSASATGRPAHAAIYGRRRCRRRHHACFARR